MQLYNDKLQEIEAQHREELKVLEARYEEQITNKDEIIAFHKEKSADMKEIANLLAKQPINVEAKAVAENQSKNVEVEMNVSGGQVSGMVGKNKGNISINASEQKQTLAEAAAEIQSLLKQLEQTNPTATEPEQIKHLNDETTPKFKRKAVAALKAAGDTAIDEFLANPYVKVGKAAILGWVDS